MLNFSKLKWLENRIHENIKTAGKKEDSKEEESPVTEYLYHCSTKDSNIAGYVWLKKAKIRFWIHVRTFKRCLVPISPFFL